MAQPVPTNNTMKSIILANSLDSYWVLRVLCVSIRVHIPSANWDFAIHSSFFVDRLVDMANSPDGLVA